MVKKIDRRQSFLEVLHGDAGDDDALKIALVVLETSRQRDDPLVSEFGPERAFENEAPLVCRRPFETRPIRDFPTIQPAVESVAAAYHETPGRIGDENARH